MLNLKNEAAILYMDSIIAHLIKCSKRMRIDCIENNKLLKNDEILITNRLTAEYLNAEKNDFRYLLQAPENYDGETDRYKGTTDIRVVSRDFFYDARDYFVI